MLTTRRECLTLGAALLAGLGLTGCRTIEQDVSAGWVPHPDLALPACSPELRLAQRATFGTTSGDLERIQSLGASAWIDEQLAPGSLDDSRVLATRLEPLKDILDADAGTLFDVDDHQAVATLRQAAVLRAVYSRRQCYERMVHFWTDHLNISTTKGEGSQYKIIDDRETIRPRALGRFRDLLGASARSAAMLGYLDNQENRRGVPNENYARELMELHTLGVGSGYTQRDVQEVARCFTGWTVASGLFRGRFRFDPAAHDDGIKTVLGRTILPGGVTEGEQVLDRLALHPATASHLTKRLCLHFLGCAPPSLHQRLASIYLSSGGEMRPILRALLMSDELARSAPLFKRPFHLAASALRGLGADTDGGSALQTQLEAMGQPLFSWPMPDGYPITEASWNSALIPRWKFAAALAAGGIDNTSMDWQRIQARADVLRLDAPEACLRALTAQDAAALPALARTVRAGSGGDIQRAAAIVMMSPEFQYC